MINYKNSPVVVNTKNNSIINSEMNSIVHRNSKPPKNRAATTNQIKSGPVFEIKGQNLATNYVHRRHNSVSSDSGNNYLNENNNSNNRINQKLFLPKITSKKSDVGVENAHELNESRKKSANSAFDAFSVAGIVGTKPYQMSKLQTNDLNSLVSGYNILNSDSNSPSFLNIINGLSSNQPENNSLNPSQNDEMISFLSEEDKMINNKQLEQYTSLLAKNQILLFKAENESGINNSKFQNARKLGLRIHHPKTKLTSLNRKNENKLNLNENKGESLNSLQLVAVPVVMKPEEYLNSNDHVLHYYQTSDSDENYDD